MILSKNSLQILISLMKLLIKITSRHTKMIYLSSLLKILYICLMNSQMLSLQLTSQISIILNMIAYRVE